MGKTDRLIPTLKSWIAPWLSAAKINDDVLSEKQMREPLAREEAVAIYRAVEGDVVGAFEDQSDFGRVFKRYVRTTQRSCRRQKHDNPKD